MKSVKWQLHLIRCLAIFEKLCQVYEIRPCNLHANAEELSASSEESLASSQMVAKSAEEQMVTSEQQVRHMDSSVQSMTELSQGVGQISISNEEMLHAADDVTKISEKRFRSSLEVADPNGYDS